MIFPEFEYELMQLLQVKMIYTIIETIAVTHTLMVLLGTLKLMLLTTWREETDHTACVEMAWGLILTLLPASIVQLEHFQNREFFFYHHCFAMGYDDINLTF